MQSDSMGLDWLIANDPKHVSPAMKAAHTKTLDHEDMAESHLGELTIGFAGDWENGEGWLEP